MNKAEHYQTAPEDRIPVAQKLIYGLGQLCNNLLAAALGCMAIVLNLGLGMNPAWIGMIMSASRFTDALTDPVMGYVSDHTQTRWGRRRPFIFAGAILAGLIFALMWQLPAGSSQRFYVIFFLVGTNLFYVAYTIFATPFIALGYELTPDYHERTRLMGFSNFLGQFAWLAAPWFYRFTENKTLFSNPVQGARTLAIIIGVFIAVFGVIPAIFTRERFAGGPRDREGLWSNVKKFFRGFFVTWKSGPFVLLCFATFLVFNGYMLGSTFTPYAMIYYVFGGNREMGGTLMGWFGTLSSICTFFIIMLTAWISTKIGKRRTFFIMISLSIVGFALKWFCYNTERPYLLLISAPFIACGIGSLFTVVGAMVADVCDLDELKTGERREGMYGAVYWWMVKLGMSVAMFIAGILLNKTGFDVALDKLALPQAERTLFLLRVFDVGIPLVAAAIAILLVMAYGITEQRAYEIRAELERRRGKQA